MSASAAGRRLCAVLPLLVASILASVLLAAPPASAGTLSPSAQGPSSLAGSQRLHHQDVPPLAERINHAANVAIAHIGDPYQYGAAGPGAFDCSGLSMYSYTHSSMILPRTAAGQYAAVHHILKMHVIRGDLVFFHDSSGHVYHVGMFLYWNGEHRAVIVHAPHSGTVVHRAPVWTSAWYAGTRRP